MKPARELYLQGLAEGLRVAPSAQTTPALGPRTAPRDPEPSDASPRSSPSASPAAAACRIRSDSPEPRPQPAFVPTSHPQQLRRRILTPSEGGVHSIGNLLVQDALNELPGPPAPVPNPSVSPTAPWWTHSHSRDMLPHEATFLPRPILHPCLVGRRERLSGVRPVLYVDGMRCLMLVSAASARPIAAWRRRAAPRPGTPPPPRTPRMGCERP